MAGPRLRPLAPAEAGAAAQPNLFRTLARRPDIMAAYAELLRAVTYTGTLEVRLKELCILRVSQLNASAY